MSQKGKEQLYEGMYVLRANLSEEARQRALERLHNEIVERGGEVRKVHDQGRRRLAYEIDGNREGYYYLLYFTAPTSAISDLWREYHLNEDLLRFITLTVDKVMDVIEFKQIGGEG